VWARENILVDSPAESPQYYLRSNGLLLNALVMGEAPISQEEAHLWRERYRVLFDRNVAGVILTNVNGRILECNGPYARILGFDSSDDVLAHSVWDFISTGQSARLSLTAYGPKGVSQRRKFACGGRMGCQFGS
jgi:PAS domain-containing protein